MRQIWHITMLSVVLVLLAAYNACGILGNSGDAKKTQTSTVLQGTNTGNPKPSEGCKKILDATCDVLTRAHPDLSLEACRGGVSITSLINNLGVPEKVLNPYYNLCDAEEATAVRANEGYLQACLGAIQGLSPDSAAVKAAYDKNSFDAFSGVKGMIPSLPEQCGQVFRENRFEAPKVDEPPPGAVLVDFDNPAVGVPSTANLLEGLYKGIEFTPGIWGWSLPFDASTSNFAVNSSSTTGDTGFNFSGGPKILLSLKAFASKGDVELRIYDDQGQSVTQRIPADRKMHLVRTNFTKPSNSIYLHRTTTLPDPYRNAGVGLDDIVYQPPSTPPVIAQIQSQYALFDRSTNQSSASFASPNTAGNLIVAQIDWQGSAQLQAVRDSAGNTYQAAGPRVTTASGYHLQIWYAKDIKASINKVTAVFTNSSRLNNLYVNEYSGADTVEPVDVFVGVSGSGITARSGSFATRAPNVLIYAGVLSEYGWGAFESDYTVRPFFGLTPMADKLVSQTGTYQMNAGLPVSTNWAVQIVGFRAK
ncbi:MAG: hypothetical protein AB7N80_16170 [Bdellovibrionales bacterium]